MKLQNQEIPGSGAPSRVSPERARKSSKTTSGQGTTQTRDEEKPKQPATSPIRARPKTGGAHGELPKVQNDQQRAESGRGHKVSKCHRPPPPSGGAAFLPLLFLPVVPPFLLFSDELNFLESGSKCQKKRKNKKTRKQDKKKKKSKE